MKHKRWVVLLLVMAASPAFGWSNKDHIQLTRIAVVRLLEDPATPPAMKAWLRGVAPDARDMDAEKQWFLHHPVSAKVRVPEDARGLGYQATIPDALASTLPRASTVDPFGVHERMLHFVDLELLEPEGAVRGYRHDLSGKPSLERVPRDRSDPRWKKAGMLPFRIPQVYDRLVASMKEGRLLETDGEDNAVKWAGFLAHYLADNTQPQHATVDYKSQSYFADRNTAPNVHGALEYWMYDDQRGNRADLREAYWPLFVAALEAEEVQVGQTDDRWQATMEVACYSYDALPLIGLAAMAASGQQGTPEHPDGPHAALDLHQFFHFTGQVGGQPLSVLQLRARQTALAVHRIERLLRQAWQEAHGQAEQTEPGTQRTPGTVRARSR